MTMVVVLFGACGNRIRVAAVPPPITGAPTPSGGAASSASTPNAARLAGSLGAELIGMASYYAEPYHGRKTANGETFDTYQELTAAHRTLPFNTVVKVMNQDNGRDVEVRINDRGPFIDGRVIDLSLKAAREIDMVRAGIVPVRLQILKEGAAPVRGAVRAGGPSPAGEAAIYAIQVGSFESLDTAEAMKRELEQRYRDVTIQSVSLNRTFYRVRVGRTGDLRSAEKLVDQLRDESFDPFVVRVN
jgi:rare lipoprotein A